MNTTTYRDAVWSRLSRRALVLSVILLGAHVLGPQTVFAAGPAKSKTVKSAVGTPYVDKGMVLAHVGIGWGGLSGGAEYGFARVDVADVLPVTFGAAVRAALDPGLFNSSYSTMTFGVGGFATAHCGFTGLPVTPEVAWLKNFDLYLGLGLGIAVASPSARYASYVPAPGIGVSSFAGLSYYFNRKLAITGEYGYIGRFYYKDRNDSWTVYYSTIGIIYKI